MLGLVAGVDAGVPRCADTVVLAVIDSVEIHILVTLWCNLPHDRCVHLIADPRLALPRSRLTSWWGDLDQIPAVMADKVTGDVLQLQFNAELGPSVHQFVAAWHLGAEHEVKRLAVVRDELPHRYAAHQCRLGSHRNNRAGRVLVPLGVVFVGTLALELAGLVLGDVVVHVTNHHAGIDGFLKLQTGQLFPPLTHAPHRLMLHPWRSHRQTVSVRLHHRHTVQCDESLGQHAQQQLTVNGDRHGVRRVIERAVNVVRVTIHTVKCQFEHGVLSGTLRIARPLVVH